MPKFLKNLSKIKSGLKNVKDKAVIAAFNEVEKHRAALEKEVDDLQSTIAVLKSNCDSLDSDAEMHKKSKNLDAMFKSLELSVGIEKQAAKVAKKAAALKKRMALLEKIEGGILKAASKDAALKAALS